MKERTVEIVGTIGSVLTFALFVGALFWLNSEDHKRAKAVVIEQKTTQMIREEATQHALKDVDKWATSVGLKLYIKGCFLWKNADGANCQIRTEGHAVINLACYPKEGCFCNNDKTDCLTRIVRLSE